MDDHGIDCPERICLECGEAVLVEIYVEAEVPQARVA
jgi:hypothetical protein